MKEKSRIKNMYCENCGNQIGENARFCPKCGGKILREIKILHRETDTKNKDQVVRELKESEIISTDQEALLYSCDWKRTNTFSISSLQYFDLLIDKENLCLIKLPKHHGGDIGLVLLIFGLLPGILSSHIGRSRDTKKRNLYRSSWINLEQKLISQAYKKDIFLTIPKSKIKNSLILKKNKILIVYKNKKIDLSKDKKECKRLNKFIETYVL